VTPLLEATSVSVAAVAKLLLQDVNLSFGSGQAAALIGPNGAGKSTLLRALAGELTPRSGHVRLLGRDLRSYSPRLLARHRAVLSQRNNITFPFIVSDVVRMGSLQENAPRVETIVEGVLAELGMIDLADRAITTLSGGEQQRVHFARTLVQLACGLERDGAGVLLLDEPTAGLDLRHQLAMLEALRRRARQGALVIAILHDLNLATLFSERIIVLARGRIDFDGTPNDAITEAMLRRVFELDATVSRLPAPGTPFVLPQMAAPLTNFTKQPVSQL
jgi:iron complex transport system ATP-binding protein